MFILRYRNEKSKITRKLIEAYENIRERIQSIKVTEAQQAEVFNHLYAFFSRYYEGGAFIPRRRYGSRETYAVPYKGSSGKRIMIKEIIGIGKYTCFETCPE